MSQRDSGYERKDRDLYETPEWVTRVLCDDLYADPGRAVGTDIEPLRDDIGKCDFLTSDWPAHHDGYRGFGAIVTNPPYDQATQFVERALRMFEPEKLGKIAMLMRADFDHAKGRSHLFRDCPAFQKKIALTKRIMWFQPEPGAKGKSPSYNHAWFVWDWQHEGKPTIGYGP